MKDVQDEAEVTVCYPGYGAVGTASIKSQSLGSFAANITRVMACNFYQDDILDRFVENDYKEWMANYSKEGDGDEEY